MPIALVAGGSERAVLHVERRVEDDRSRAQLDAHQPRPRAADVGRAGERRQVRAAPSRRRRSARSPRSSPSPQEHQRALGRHRRRQHPGDDGRRHEVDERHAAGDQAVDAHLQHRRRPLRRRAPRTPRRTRCASTTSNPHFWRTHDGGKTWTEINTGIAAGAVANSIREDPRTAGTALRGDRHAGVGLVRRRRSLAVAAAQHAGDLGARSPGEGRQHLPVLRSRRRHARPRLLDSRRRHAAAPDRRRCASRAVGRLGVSRSSRQRRSACASARTIPRRGRPKLPAGENPPPGGIIDYYLGADAVSPVTLEILDAAGKVVRSFSSADTVRDPHPALDPAAYDQSCAAKAPTRRTARLPLYWPAPPDVACRRSAACIASRGICRLAQIRDRRPDGRR